MQLPTDGRATCRIGMCVQRKSSNGGPTVGPFAYRYQGNGATPCQYIDIPLERQLIHLIALQIFGADSF